MKTSQALGGYLLIAVVFWVSSADYCMAQGGSFWVGSWCLMGTNDNNNNIVFDNIPPGSPNWYLKPAEKTKLENLGLNFMIACLSQFTADGEVGMNNYGIEKGGAFKSNMSISPPNASSPTAYLVWNTIRELGGPGNPTWEAKVNNGWTSMNTLHSNKTGVHSFLAGAEAELNNPAKYPWLKFICDAVHAKAPGVLALVEGGQPSDLNAFFQAVPSIDVYENGAYVLTTGLPYTGSTFQNALQSYVNEASRSISALKNNLPNVPLHFIIQTHWASGPCINFRVPTQEELLCQINLAVTYGAKGIVNYVYSRQEYIIPPGQCGPSGGTQIEEGLLDINRNPTSLYTSLQTINTNYQSTEQSLVNIGANFLNLSWQAGFSIHLNTTEPISSTYKLHDVTAKPPGGATDAENETYVEVGVLQNGSTNHYMVVNRRCTASETREVTITFQANSNNAYRITDVYTGSTTTCYVGSGITTFCYTLSLGPGQGKLLKVEDLGYWSSTITSNTTWSGNICVDANVTVNSGVTLTVSPGAIVQFCSGKSLTVNGSLVADSNDPNNRITFTGTSATPGFWNGITINANTNAKTLRRCNVQYATTGIRINYTGNINDVTIDKCRLSNNSSSGIYVNGNANSSAWVHPTIQNNHIHNNSSSGISMSNYAKPIINGNRIENDNGYGIEANTSSLPEVKYNFVANNSSNGLLFSYSSNAQVHRNTVQNNTGGGVYSFFNSNITAHGCCDYTGRNKITGNGGSGIYANSSSPTFGYSVTGYNWIQTNSSYEAQQIGSGYQILAENCYWGGGAPAPSEISGNVDYSPYTTTLPNPVGWGQSDAHDPSYLQPSKSGTITELPPAGRHHAFLRLAVASGTNGSPINWTEEVRAAIEEGLATGDWSRASALITELHRELQDARVPEVDFTLVTGYANRPDVVSFIRKMLALVLMEKDLVDNRIPTALAKLATFGQSNAEHKAEFLANGGLIHLYRQHDLAAAQNILSQLQAMAQSGNVIAAEHVKFFGRIIEDYKMHQAIVEAGLEKPILASDHAITPPMTIVLAQNYPNPFNPETTIRFHLNERRQVRLVIYDLAGHRVRTLIDGELAAGEQTITWDGRDQQGRPAASGVYFYELVTGNKVERRKMTLIR